jgi:tetratricopeptide (TPR) repeat protein
VSGLIFDFERISGEIATRCISHTGPADVSALEKLLKELRTVRPPTAPPRQQSRQLRDAATQAYKRGLYKEALALYTKCLATDCDEKDAVLANRAACWLMVEEAERAVEDCKKASDVIAEQLPKADDDERKRLVSQRSKVATRLASSLQRLGRIDEALAVVGDDPSQKEKRNQLEQCQSTQKQAAEAYAGEEYSRAKRCFVKLRDDYNVTDDADARVKLAACHVRTRRPLKLLQGVDGV